MKTYTRCPPGYHIEKDAEGFYDIYCAGSRIGNCINAQEARALACSHNSAMRAACKKDGGTWRAKPVSRAQRMQAKQEAEE